jgi:hypothetical protein
LPETPEAKNPKSSEVLVHAQGSRKATGKEEKRQ